MGDVGNGLCLLGWGVFSSDENALKLTVTGLISPELTEGHRLHTANGQNAREMSHIAIQLSSG